MTLGVRLQQRLLELIHPLYLAPGTTNGWLAFLNPLCDVMEAAGAAFVSRGDCPRRGDLALATTTDASFVNACGLPWPLSDERSWRSILGGPAAASVVVDPPYIAGIVERGPHSVSVLLIHRSEDRAAFGVHEAAFLEALIPHLRCAVELHRRLVEAQSLTDDLFSVVDHVLHAVFLVEVSGRVTLSNPVGDELTARGDGLVVERGELRAARPEETRKLHLLIGRAADTSHGGGTGGVLALGRPSGRRPLVVLVSPLRRAMSSRATRAVAMVIVTDPERGVIPDETVLRAFLGLTPAEAKLARLLAEGFTVEQTATRLGVRSETIRTRLKTIFEKTNTHRQVELVGLILRAAPRIIHRTGPALP